MSRAIDPTESKDKQAALAAAEAAWDTIDVAKVRDVSWFSVPGVAAHIGDLTGGQPVHMFAAPFLAGRASLTGAAIACGDMVGERNVFDQFDFSTIDGYDLSRESLSKASVSYNSSCVTFNPVHGDSNKIELPPNRYDLVLGWHGIHHVEAIDHLFAQVEKSLTDGGIFMMYEWIGPRYLQFPAVNRWLSRWLLRTMFTRAERVTHEGRRKGRWLQPAPNEFEPSEAVASDRIYSALVERFDVVRAVVFGGLLYPMFEGLGANPHLQAAASTQQRVRLVAALEKMLTRARIVQPLFMISVARRRLKPAG